MGGDRTVPAKSLKHTVLETKEDLALGKLAKKRENSLLRDKTHIHTQVWRIPPARPEPSVG